MSAPEQIVILPDDLDTMIEESGKPQLPTGKYLAVIAGGEAKVSDNGKNSYGITWKMIVNSNPDSFTDGWDTEAQTIPVNMYTYIGKLVNGRLTDTDKGWAFIKLMKFLGVSGKALNIKEHVGRQIGVVIEHRPGKDDQDAMKADPTFVPDQLFLGIKTVLSYSIGDDVCPKLSYLFGEEGADEPIEEDVAVEPKAEEKASEAETPKKKRGAKADKPEGEPDPAW